VIGLHTIIVFLPMHHEQWWKWRLVAKLVLKQMQGLHEGASYLAETSARKQDLNSLQKMIQ
jgi:hypothetical protein